MQAKELIVEGWLNSKPEYNFSMKSKKIKVVHVFQMLCPGCIYHGVPQTKDLYEKFLDHDEVEIIGLHSVFENHKVMGREALEVFVKELRLRFPIAIDKQREGHWMPATMKAYGFQGTPTTIVVDQKGELRLQHFGILKQDFLEDLVTELLKNK